MSCGIVVLVVVVVVVVVVVRIDLLLLCKVFVWFEVPIREGFKVENKKKCDNYHTLGF